MPEATLLDSLPYSSRLRRALRADPAQLAALVDQSPSDWRDHLIALQAIHDLHIAPLHELGGAEWLQHDPDVARIKADLERDVLLALTFEPPGAARPTCGAGAVAAMRTIANRDLVPPVYDWVADRADLGELIGFLAIEGGPDGGFDDLVALCQLGLDGPPKLALAMNYWDEILRRCQEIPGQRLFQYVGDDGEIQPIYSHDVNNYLREAARADVTAKDFRTWVATVSAAAQLASIEAPASAVEARKFAGEVVAAVAKELGNTPAVCRTSYIHPTVLTGFGSGELHEDWASPPRRRGGLIGATRPRAWLDDVRDAGAPSP